MQKDAIGRAVMAIDDRRDPGARARAEVAGKSMSYIIGAALIVGIIGMLVVFAIGENTTSDTTTPPAVPVTQPQTSTPR